MLFLSTDGNWNCRSLWVGSGFFCFVCEWTDAFVHVLLINLVNNEIVGFVSGSNGGGRWQSGKNYTASGPNERLLKLTQGANLHN